MLRAAAAGLFRVHWSPDVLDEVHRTLVDQILVEEVRVRYLLTTMRRAFPEAETHDYRSLIQSLRVDCEDRHVLAAAIVARADVIITSNVRHFPAEAVAPFGVEVQHPDDFLVQLFEMYPDEISFVVASRARDLGDTVSEVLGYLHRHTPQFVEKLKSFGIS